LQRIRAWALDPETGEVMPLGGKYRGRVAELGEGARVISCEGVPRREWLQGGDVPAGVTRTVVSNRDASDIRTDLLDGVDDDVLAQLLPQSQSEYYDGVARNHFSPQAAGSRFTTADGREGLEDVVRAAVLLRGPALLGGEGVVDDADELGVPEEARVPGALYFKVPVPGRLGIVDKHTLTDAQREGTTVRAETLKVIPARGAPGDDDYVPEKVVTGLVIDTPTVTQPATAFATVIVGPAPGAAPGDPLVVWTAHPVSPITPGPHDLAAVAGLVPDQGDTKTVAELMDNPEIRFLRVGATASAQRGVTDVDPLGGAGTSMLDRDLRAAVNRISRNGGLAVQVDQVEAEAAAKLARVSTAVLAEALENGLFEFIQQGGSILRERDVQLITRAAGRKLGTSESGSDFVPPQALRDEHTVLNLTMGLSRVLGAWKTLTNDSREHLIGDLLDELRPYTPRRQSAPSTKHSEKASGRRAPAVPAPIAPNGAGNAPRRRRRRSAPGNNPAETEVTSL
jgi:hypothetical protein